MLAILLSALVTFTLPAFKAGDDCGPGLATLSDLDSVRVRYMISGERVWRLAVQAQVRGMEGLPMDATIPTSQVATVTVETKRIGGKAWSCMSNLSGVNLTVAVPYGPDLASDTTLYDVLGRRLHRPYPHGVAFTRHGRLKIIR